MSLTRLISEAEQGNGQPAQLYAFVYNEFHRLARGMLNRERVGHTLCATALVHEAYLRLSDGESIPWKGRAYFFAAAAEAMRRILIDHARRRNAQRRGGPKRGTADSGITHLQAPPAEDPIDLLALDQALTRLEAEYPDKAKLVKLLYFAGLSLDDAAAVLGTSRSSVHRQWLFARAWLKQATAGRDNAPAPPDPAT